MTDENLDWITTVVLLPGIFYDILCICIYLMLTANLNDVMYCIPVELKWKETYWNWSDTSVWFHWYEIFWFLQWVFARISTKAVFAWLGVFAALLDGVMQMHRLCNSQHAAEIIWKQSVPCDEIWFKQVFSWIFAFGFTGKTPWTTTNHLYFLHNNVKQVWETPTVWLNRSWQTPLVQVGFAQGCHWWSFACFLSSQFASCLDFLPTGGI